MIAALYEDDEILVLDKPAGLASQPGEGVRASVVEAVQRDFGFRPFLVHRLDKETAGCLVVARSSPAASKWSRLLESRELRKTYRAIVAGGPALGDGDSGRIEESVRGPRGDRPAITEWRLLSSFGDYAYLELVLGTGRMHQIRIHLASRGMPILGDDRHGDFALNKRLRAELGLRRLLLVAWSLELRGALLARASVPAHFSDFLSRFEDAPPADAPAAEHGGGR
jgi:23S rRNA pseudouridine955/2504/2580 synthase